MTKTLQYHIDDLTYLSIQHIVMEKELTSGNRLETNNVIKLLIDKALKEFIIENNDLTLKRYNHELSIIDDELEGKKITLESIFPQLAKEKE